MTQYERITGKVFGGNATATGNDPQIAQFGSALANTFVGTTDPETIQSLPAWGQGWIGAVTPETQYPPLPEMTGAMKVLSHQICGILQQGVSTWDNGTIYYTGNFASLNGKLYISQIDENQGNNPATDTTNWQEFSSGGGGLEIGDIGIAPLGIDETQGKRRYLNGQLIIQEQYAVFSEKVKNAISLYPTLGCTEQDWQTIATMSVGGQVGKFVVDDVGGTIRLPKIIMPIQGLTDLSKLAEIVSAGMPNVTQTFTAPAFVGITGDNLINITRGSSSVGTQNQNSTMKENSTWDIDFSRANEIYGNSDTVQQEQIQYPYFIQVATGAETEDNIINTLELNNPYSLGDSKYSPVALNNLSWLKSEGQYNAKADYPSYYDWLLRIYNGTEIVSGVNVKLSTETFDDYDWVLNTANETFRLPLVNGSEEIPDLNSQQTLAVVASGTPVDIPCNGFLRYRCETCTYASINQEVVTTSNNAGASTTLNIMSTLLQKGQATPYYNGTMTNLYFTKARGNGSLYFYVGETVQNANLINAGRIEEKITEALAKPHIVETYVNSTSWYRVYSDGWCEQGGINTTNSTNARTQSLLISYKDTNYSIQVSYSGNGSLTNGAIDAYEKAVGSFKLKSWSSDSLCWNAKGYIR